MTVSVSQPLIWYGLLCYHMSTLFAGQDRICTTFTERPHRNGVCGQNIPETLSLLCNDHFPRFTRLAGILIGRRSAMSYLATRGVPRGKRTNVGIVCECCFNQCDIDELSEYCLKDRKRK